MPIDVTALISLVVSVLTAALLYMKLRKERAGLSSTIADTIAKQSLSWLKTQGVFIEDLQADIATLRVAVAALEKELGFYKAYIKYLLDGVSIQHDQICEAGETAKFEAVSFEDFKATFDV